MNRPLEKTAFKAGSEDPFEQAATLPAGAARRSTSSRRSPRRALARPTSSLSADDARRCSTQLASDGRRGRGRDAASRGQAAGHARRRRAVHGDLQGRRLRGAAARVAAAALPGLRVRPAGVLAARARGRAAAAARGAVPVLRGRGLRVLPGAAAGDQLPAELQRRLLRHPAAGAGLLLVRDHGPDRDGARCSRSRSGSSRRRGSASSRRSSCARAAATRS